MPLRADIATGRTTLRAVDLRLPGFIPLALARTYYSGNEDDGPFGVGWTFNLDITLRVERDRVVFCGSSGEETIFKPIDVGVQAKHATTGLILQNHPDVFVVLASPRRQHVFPKRNASRGSIRIDRVEDPNGNHVQFAYSGSRLAALADTVGRRIDFDYSGGHVAAIYVSGPGGDGKTRIRSFRYDMPGNLKTVQDAAGREVAYEYRNHWMVARANRLGGTQYGQYGKEGRCLALWHGDGSAVRHLAYDDHRQTTRVVGTDGDQTLYRTLDDHLVLQRIGPQAEEQHYYYSEAQQLVGFSDDAGAVVTFQNLEDGVLTQVDGESRTAVIQFNEAGLAEQVVDSFDNAYALAYDDQFNLTRVTTPRGSTWTFERDKRGRVSRITSPEGRWVRRVHGSGGLEVEDELGLRYKERVDLFGRRTERVDALRRQWRQRYDAEGRLTKVTIGDDYTVQFSYNADGQLTGLADSEGRQTKRRYDAFGRLLEYGGARGDRWQFRYDQKGHLIEAANAQRTSAQFTYDDRGRLMRFTSLNGAAETYRYDDEGIVVEREADEVRRTYSPLGELMEEVGPDGAGQTVEYGPSGELRLFEAGERSLLVDYDAEGQIAAIDSGDLSLAFSYDRDGHLVAIEEEEARRVELRYDQRGRAVEVHTGEGSVYGLTYDDGNRLTALALPSGGQITCSYDGLDCLLERRIQSPSGRQDDRHQFDEDPAAGFIEDQLDLHGQPEGGDGETVDEEAEGGLTLFQAVHGLVLAVQFDGLHVPIWFQDDVLHREEMSLQDRIICACMDGMKALFARRHPIHDTELLRRWTATTAARFDFTEVPGSREVVRMPLLRSFFLRQPFVDRFSSRHALGGGDAHWHDWRRSFDPLLTGTHVEGSLNPPVWNKRIIAPRLNLATVLFKRGGVDPDDVLRLFVSDSTKSVV